MFELDDVGLEVRGRQVGTFALRRRRHSSRS
jgi:hypothetical protein